MRKVLVAGMGKVGSLIALQLSQSGDFHVIATDVSKTGNDIAQIDAANYRNLQFVQRDVSNADELSKLLEQYQVEALVSCLPYYLNVAAAKAAAEARVHYFDLTEDTAVTATIKQLASSAQKAFVPQCGLAPGFVSVVANSIMQEFQEIDTVKLRVGALPQSSSNAFFYALTWSTDGLINQYGNACQAIINRESVLLAPLAGLEYLQLDGLNYEAFNTSGGLGSLSEIWQGKVNNMTYKTVRYPGHCEKMRMLMEDLKLNHDRQTLKRILENAIPKTHNDVVVIYASVTGNVNGVLTERDYVKKVYPQQLLGKQWSAIQTTTASAACVTVDLILNSKKNQYGFIYQENIPLTEFLNNRFAACFRQ